MPHFNMPSADYSRYSGSYSMPPPRHPHSYEYAMYDSYRRAEYAPPRVPSPPLPAGPAVFVTQSGQEIEFLATAMNIPGRC